jgi:hypothetical protein
MKLLARLLSLIVVLSITTLLMNCGSSSGEGKSEEETQLDKLKGIWNLASASLDGTPRTDFEDVTMTITGTYAKAGTYSYSFTGNFPEPSPWPIKTPGTFKFDQNNISTKLIRGGDNIVMDYTVSGSSMSLSFTCATCNYPGGAASGRVGEVNGEWVFSFTK